MTDTVGIRCLAIPDGFSANGDKARLSLVLTPDLRGRGYGKQVSLSDWPAAIAQCAKDGLLHIYLGNANYRSPIAVKFRTDDPVLAHSDDAKKLWHSIFNGFNSLVSILTNSDVSAPPSDPKTSSDLNDIRKDLQAAERDESEAPKVPVTAVLDKFADKTVTFGNLTLRLDSMNWVQTRYLDEAVNTFHDDSHFLRLFALLAAQELRASGPEGAQDALDALAKAYQGEAKSILGENAVQWVNSIGAAIAAQPFQHRMLGSVQASVLTQLLQAGLGHPPGDAFGLLQRLAPGSPPANLSQSLENDRREAMEQMFRSALGMPSTKPGGPGHLVQGRGKGKEMMRALFLNAAQLHSKPLSARTDAEVLALAKVAQPYQTEASKNFAQFHKHWRNNAVPVPPTEPELDAARRKFFGIRALPALAKFLRLTVDVELDISLAELGNYDCAAAMFVEHSDDNTPFGKDLEHTPDVTAFPLGTDKSHSFQPANSQSHHRLWANATDLANAIKIKNGVVDLRAAETSSLDPRFLISILNLPAGMTSLRMKAEQDNGAQRNGTLLDSVPSKTPERQSRGLQLIDHQAQDQIAGYMAQVVSGPPMPGDPTRPFFAEDLVIGYRPYIQRTRPGVDCKPNPWRSLVARCVSIAEIARYVDNADYRYVQTRDHGYVRPASKAQSDSQKADSQTAAQPSSANKQPAPAAAASAVTKHSQTTDGQIFAWMGASIGLSTDPGSASDADKPGPGESQSDDLALDIEYSFSDACEDLLPALRVGDSYMMGLSPVYPNCAGPALKDASETFDDTKSAVTLGDNSDATMKPFKFGPPRDIPAPVVLISEAEGREWQEAEQKPASQRGATENVARIVLRSANNRAHDKDNVKRYLAPPRASFEVAEQSGMFDQVQEAIPPGAFNGYKLNPQDGGFPSGTPAKPGKNSPAVSRSPVLMPIGNAPPPTARYYPDPLARNLKVAFERAGATPAGFPDEVPLHAFWKQGASPVTAQPIELLFKRWGDGREGGQVDFDDTTGKVTGLKSRVTRVLDRLAIEIAPAEEASLRIWCVPDKSDLLRSHAVLSTHAQTAAKTIATHQQTANQSAQSMSDALSRGVELLGSGLTSDQVKEAKMAPPDVVNLLPVVDGALDKIHAALTSQTPDNGLNAWLSLKIVHAVEKPLAVPAIPCVSTDKGPQLTIHPVRLPQKTTWQDYVTLIPSDALDKVLGLPSQAGGTTTYFVGQLDFDRASTGEIRIEASWPETDPASAIQKVKSPPGADPNTSKKYKVDPPRKDRLLFNLKVPRDRGLNPEGKLDLTFDETGILRGLNYVFTDTAAREISLRIVATSRFTSDFPAAKPPPGPPDPYALGQFEKESRPPVGPRLDNAKPESYRIYKIMLPATAPPPSPTVSRLEWIMPETLTAFDPARRICVEKSFYPRLYLGQDWCGAHELLAVICAPDNFVSDRPLSPDLMPPPVPEPIPLSAEELLNAPAQRKILASEFTTGQYYKIAESVSRWGADATTRSGTLTGTITRERFSGFIASKHNVALPANDSSNVSLLLYKPQFDENAGEFYVDIGIDPGAAHSPIVELVIARYQPYVIDPNFQLSGILRVRPFQVAPKRKVEVLIQDGRNVTAIVQGVGYTDRNPEIPGNLKEVPPQYASRIKYPLQNIRVISLNDNNATTGIQSHNELGQPLSVSRVTPQFFHPELIWISEFKLPLPRANYRYGLQFDEVDLHFPDEAYESGADSEHLPILERPSNFSLTIDLQRGLYQPNGRDQTAISPRG
jgi:hypothetical protein